MEIDSNFLGENIVKRRKALKMGQGVLADKIGISRKALNEIENGHKWPQYNNLTRIAGALDCSVKDLFKDEPSLLLNEAIKIGSETAAKFYNDFINAERKAQALEKELSSKNSLPPDLVAAWIRAQDTPSLQVFALWVLTGAEKYKYELETRWPGVFRALEALLGNHDNILREVDE